MAVLIQWDEIVRKIERIGERGTLPKTFTRELNLLVDELQRRLGLLEEAQRLVIAHLRLGPTWGDYPDGYLRQFSIDWFDADTDNLVVVEHGAGMILNAWTIVRIQNDLSIGDASDPGGGNIFGLNFGDIRIVREDEHTATFQLSRQGILNKARFVVLMWRSVFVPVDFIEPLAGPPPGRPRRSPAISIDGGPRVPDPLSLNPQPLPDEGSMILTNDNLFQMTNNRVASLIVQ